MQKIKELYNSEKFCISSYGKDKYSFKAHEKGFYSLLNNEYVREAIHASSEQIAKVCGNAIRDSTGFSIESLGLSGDELALGVVSARVAELSVQISGVANFENISTFEEIRKKAQDLENEILHFHFPNNKV